MRVLGLETSGEWGGVALWDDRGLVAEITFRHELQLSRLLSSRVREVLSMAGWEPSTLQGIAVSLGPGSFTGLRIGVTEAKALAYALDVPVVGIGTLDALAAEYPFSGTLFGLIAASATELFGAAFGPSPVAERLESQLFWKGRVSETPDAMVIGVLGRHRELFETCPMTTVYSGFDALPRAATIARWGRERLLRGESDPTHALVPRYLRLSTPEVRKQEAARQESP
jgi:tRNA threonylcarbamoyladenosine biosynthesis protein TsaB